MSWHWQWRRGSDGLVGFIIIDAIYDTKKVCYSNCDGTVKVKFERTVPRPVNGRIYRDGIHTKKWAALANYNGLLEMWGPVFGSATEARHAVENWLDATMLACGFQ